MLTSSREIPESARQAYDSYASSYDDFNHGYRYERWTAQLLARAQEAGVEGDRLLDIGCGTGLSFLPMLDREWRVTGCDISPGMLEVARSKVGERATLTVADMRKLPVLGQFDLVWAVNDAVNYLLSVEELEATLAGMHRNLALDGIVVFDVNTLVTYRTFFSDDHVVEQNGRQFFWKGETQPDEVLPGSISRARFEARDEPGTAHVHQQRHFPQRDVLTSIEAASLRCIGVFGELEGDLDSPLDEDRHTKAVYVCRRA